jgi:hypothetical protein
MQPAAAQVGVQKWARPQSKQSATRQFPHQPKRSAKAAPHVAQ